MRDAECDVTNHKDTKDAKDKKDKKREATDSKGCTSSFSSFFSFRLCVPGVSCVLFVLCLFAVSFDVPFSGAASDLLPRRSDLLDRLGVPAWHSRGWRGQGLKVAVLDSGFHGYKAHLGAALPPSVRVRSFRFDGNLEAKDSPHGILCAEVIHGLAPEAELLLANWEPECPDQFLAAVRWARRQGARIISCSIIMPSWSDCEGHGRVHEELARLLGSGDRAGDALFFASAGNTAQRHWSGPFADGGDGYHVWKDANGAAHRENVIHPWSSERVSVELCCPSASLFEVSVSDAVTGIVVSRAHSTDGNSAVAAFIPESGRDYRVLVRRVGNAKSGGTPTRVADSLRESERTRGASAPHFPPFHSIPPFHLVVLGGGLQYASSAGSIPFPGDGREVVAVGAVDSAGRRLAYSSCGPKSGFVKPDLVARVPFPSCWRSRPFAGTSAAAPQASAAAALLWSRHADWNAGQIRTALRDAARPCSANSPNWETGHGLLRLLPP